MRVQVRPNTLEPALVRLKSSGEFSLEGYRAALGIPQLVHHPLPPAGMHWTGSETYQELILSTGVCTPQCLVMPAMATASLEYQL